MIKRIIVVMVFFSFHSNAFGSEDADLSKYSYFPEVALTVPQPISVGIGVGMRDIPEWQAYLNGGYFYFDNQKGVKISIYSIEAGIKYYINNGWFAPVLGLGYLNMNAWTDKIGGVLVNDTPLATSAGLGLANFYVAPGLEVRIRCFEGGFMSFGIGAQFPIAGFSAVTLVNSFGGGAGSSVKVDAENYTNRLAYLIIPKVVLFRLTWDL